MRVELRAVHALKAHPLNAEIYGDEADDELISRVQMLGILHPILITQDGVVISGHRRLDAARKLGLAEVPVLVSPLADPLDVEEVLIEANRQRQPNNEQRVREYRHLKALRLRRAERLQGAPVASPAPPAVASATSEEVQGAAADAYGSPDDAPHFAEDAYGSPDDAPHFAEDAYGSPGDAPHSAEEAYGAADAPHFAEEAYGATDAPHFAEEAYGAAAVPLLRPAPPVDEADPQEQFYDRAVVQRARAEAALLVGGNARVLERGARVVEHIEALEQAALADEAQDLRALLNRRSVAAAWRKLAAPEPAEQAPEDRPPLKRMGRVADEAEQWILRNLEHPLADKIQHAVEALRAAVELFEQEDPAEH